MRENWKWLADSRLWRDITPEANKSSGCRDQETVQGWRRRRWFWQVPGVRGFSVAPSDHSYLWSTPHYRRCLPSSLWPFCSDSFPPLPSALVTLVYPCIGWYKALSWWETPPGLNHVQENFYERRFSKALHDEGLIVQWCQLFGVPSLWFWFCHHLYFAGQFGHVGTCKHKKLLKWMTSIFVGIVWITVVHVFS